MTVTKIVIEILGWVGSTEVILAYALVSSQKIESDNFWYQFLNLTGAILLIINTIYNESYPSMFINVVWVVIAIVALSKMRFKRKA